MWTIRIDVKRCRSLFIARRSLKSQFYSKRQKNVKNPSWLIKTQNQRRDKMRMRRKNASFVVCQVCEGGLAENNILEKQRFFFRPQILARTIH